jgi:hypothetical protein
MKNIFVINGGQIFGHSGGRFNKTLCSIQPYNILPNILILKYAQPM